MTPHDGAPTVVRVSPREYEVAQYLASPMAAAEIAEQLYVGVQTIKNHLTSLYVKLGIDDRTHKGKRQLACWLILAGRVQLVVGKSEQAPDERRRLDFTAHIDHHEDPDFERRRLLAAFERFLDERLAVL